MPTLAGHGRAIALDLAGYGKSGLPAKGDYGIHAQYGCLAGFIDSLQLKNITLVVTDLGSVLGLKYAVENPDNIKQIVFMEAVFMPTEQWFQQLPLMQRAMFSLMRHPNIAEKIIVSGNMLPGMMMRMAVDRKLSDLEMAAYLKPYEHDLERRKVMLTGPGPATFPKQGISVASGDFADEVNKIAIGLQSMAATKPYLLLYGSPGMITGKPAIDYARQNFPNLTVAGIGDGKHFLAEDHPKAIAKAIVTWMSPPPK